MPLSGDRPTYVLSEDSESLLDAVTAGVSDPNSGLFGPESITWRINRESALFLGAGRAALLQLAHPWVMAALAEHSNLLDQPIVRFHNTFRIVFTMVFGSLGQAAAAAQHLYGLHTRIRGELKEDAGRWQRGAHYEANEIGALRWVYSTLVESAVVGYECALGPLTVAEREQYYAESRRLAGLFGLPSAALPESWDAFAEYNRQMHDSDSLAVSGAARAYAAKLLAGSGSWVRPPRWFRSLTAAWMPAPLRAEFFPDFGLRERSAAESVERRLRGIYRRLPAPLRHVGPWQEAQARLAGQPVGLLARMSNRFWIGEERLPFEEQLPLSEER
jgi:uncharacterized protein (DUF2236 family)